MAVDERLDAEAVDLAQYRESAGLRLRFVLWRSLALFGLIYLVNAVFTAVDVIVDGGSVTERAQVVRILTSDGLLGSSDEFTSLALPLIGIAVITVLLTATARLRYAFRARSYRRQLAAHRVKMNREFEQKWPGSRIDDREDIEAWVAEVLTQDAPDRWKKLQQIREWFSYDELLVQWTALEIEKRRFRRDLTGSVLASIGAVAFARLVVLLS